MAARLARLGALAAATLALAAVPMVRPAPSGAATPSATVTMRVADVMPDAPLPSNHPHQLDVVLSLHNGTGRTLTDVSVSADRGYPITTQQALDRAFAHPKPPSSDSLFPVHSPPAKTTLLPGDSELVFRTSTDIPQDAGICLCANAIYPLYFTARSTAGGVTTDLASAQTFIPSFKEKVAKVQVGWLWPLLDRPHRLGTDPSVFTDDTLAQEVARGGRLATMLRIASRVAPQVPMTLVVDPDLIDELAVMSAGPYRLQLPGKPATTVRTGTSLATAWLQRLSNLLTIQGVEIDFTPAGDPAVDSLARNGLSWTVGLSQAEQADVTKALGGQTPLSDIAWPVGGDLSQVTLDTLVSQGNNTVVLDGSALRAPRAGDSTPVRDALAPLPTGTGSAVAALTSARIQRLTADVLQEGPAGLAKLPRLVAEVALRVIGSLHRSHFLLITPPRDLGMDPAHPLDADVAVRTIRQTAHTSWASPEPLRAAASSITPVDQGVLRARSPSVDLAPAVLDAVHYVTDSLHGLRSLFYQRTDATKAHLDSIPTTVQRIESSSLLDQPSTATAAIAALRSTVENLRQKSVYLVPPAHGDSYTYTLTSDHSSITVTVVNNLNVPGRVHLNVSLISGPPGFHAQDLGMQKINPGLKKQLKIPTSVTVLGRYDLQVNLSTPDGLSLGDPITVSVRSTALGAVGVVITIVAGVVLAVALLVRVITRLRRRRRKAALRLATPPAGP